MKKKWIIIFELLLIISIWMILPPRINSSATSNYSNVNDQIELTYSYVVSLPMIVNHDNGSNSSSPDPTPGLPSIPTETPGPTLTPSPTPVNEPTDVPSPTPTEVPGEDSITIPSSMEIFQSEWSQDAHDPLRSGYIAEIPSKPWNLAWTWNASDSSGGISAHFYDAPRDARTITGGAHVYVPAGAQGLFALAKSDGHLVWHFTAAMVNGTPAYDPNTRFLYVGGTNGIVYQINSDTGEIVKSVSVGSALNKSILLVEHRVYVVSDNGKLHKINSTTMSISWSYASNSIPTTALAYSYQKDAVIFGTQDLYIHAVDGTTGERIWRSKPTIHQAVSPYTYDYWPVVADQHGIVFVRLNLGMDGLWSGPGNGNMYLGTNADTRLYLEQNPVLKNLFALNLEDGSEAFIPAVGFGGVESLVDGEPELESGPLPIIKVFEDGSEVAYEIFRSSQGNPPDGRWDSHMGEMVLDDQTIPGLVAGDLRFVDFGNSYTFITDEQCPLTMAGNTIFHAHWGASESVTLIDRNNSLGLTHDNPVTSSKNPAVIRRISAVSDYRPSTHYTNAGLSLYNDGRYWNGPGYWVYWNQMDPPTPVRSAYSEGILPRYTYVSDGLIIVEGNGGDLSVFTYTQ